MLRHASLPPLQSSSPAEVASMVRMSRFKAQHAIIHSDRFTRKDKVVLIPSLPMNDVSALSRRLLYQMSMQHLSDRKVRWKLVPVIKKQPSELAEILEF
jgi:hypothetical protein